MMNISIRICVSEYEYKNMSIGIWLLSGYDNKNMGIWIWVSSYEYQNMSIGTWVSEYKY